MTGLSSGGGYTVLGFTFDGPPPLGRIHLDLQPGLSVLYGKNAVGKTRLLSALTAAARGYAFEGSQGVIHLEVEDVSAAPEPDEGFLGALLDGISIGAHRDLPGFALAVEVPNALGPVYHDRASFENVTWQYLESEESNWESWDLAAGAAACCGYFSLRAVGDVQPLWEIWISDQLREGDPLHEAFSAAETSARWFADVQRDLGPKGIIPDVQGRVEQILRDLPGVVAELSRISPWSVGATPLLDLVQDFHFVRPTWVPVELRRIGTTTSGPLGLVLVDEAEPDLDGETAQRLDGVGAPVFSDDGSLSDKAVALIGTLEGQATSTFNSWVGSQSTLKFRLGTRREWFLGNPPAWMCVDENNSAVPVSKLSHGRRRWAVAAIRLALGSESESGRPSIVLSDEPEAGLHRTAERQMVSGFRTLTTRTGRAGIVATHSPAFLLAESHARLLQVRRELSGATEVKALNGLPEDEDLGLTKADMLALRRVFVFVEGQHDKIVLEGFFASELRAAFAQILVLRGAKQVITAAYAEPLLDATDAPFLIVLDKIGEPAIRFAWDEAKSHLAAGRFEEAIASVRGIRTIRKDEAGFLSRLGEAAVRTGALHRLFVHGLPEDDILLYLHEGADLVRKKKAQSLRDIDVREALSKLDEVPTDLTDLRDEIQRLSAAFGGRLPS